MGTLLQLLMDSITVAISKMKTMQMGIAGSSLFGIIFVVAVLNILLNFAKKVTND